MAYPEKNLSQQPQPTFNITSGMGCPGNSGGRQVLTPVRHTYMKLLYA